MTSSDPTCIGTVRHVLGATVTIELDPALAGTSPIWRGRIVPVGQVGSLVRISQGSTSLLGSVVLVGISDLTSPLPPSLHPDQGKRWLQIQLLGEIDALGSFRRGVSTYPGLDDDVHFVSAEDLVSVYPPEGSDHLRIGSLAAASDVAMTMSVQKLVTRHSAIVGSTGAGKTSAVASIVQRIGAGWPSANVLVVDPHGEYEYAFEGIGEVRSVRSGATIPLRVPYWALGAAQLLRVLCGIESRTVLDRFSELVAEQRRDFSAKADWLQLDPQSITADTPIPYDLRIVWYQLDFENRSTLRDKVSGEVALVADGDPEALLAADFEPHALGTAAPFRGPTFGHFSPAPDRLRVRLSDGRFAFFFEIPDPSAPDPLPGMVSEWLGGAMPVSVLDMSGIPSDVADVAVGVVLELLFELATRSEDEGVGRPRPVLVVLEEAHRYLSSGAGDGLARGAVNRIAREGRKYGMGLMMVSQRPSELPDTSLAQCGTIVSLRLTNATDQSAVRSALPDSIAGLANALPSLRTGEAIISGEACVLPSRVAIDRPFPEPKAGDPSLDSWLVDPPGPVDVKSVVAAWRGHELQKENDEND